MRSAEQLEGLEFGYYEAHYGFVDSDGKFHIGGVDLFLNESSHTIAQPNNNAYMPGYVVRVDENGLTVLDCWGV